MNEYRLWLLLILVQLLPVWCFHYFPSQDGPDFLQNARVLLTFANQPFLQQYYALNPAISPNYFLHVIAATLMFFLPSWIVEKLLMTGYIVLLPVAARYAVTAINRKSAFVSWLIFPLIYNPLFHLGFWSFSYSLPMFFFVFGYWVRHFETLDGSKTARFAALNLLLYCCHPISFVLAAMTVCFMLVYSICSKALSTDAQAGIVHPGKSVILTGLAFLPASLLLLLFVGQQGAALQPRHFSVNELLQYFLSMWQVSFNNKEALCSDLLLSLFVLMTLGLLAAKLWKRTWQCWDWLALLAVMYFGLYLKVPAGLAGGTYMNLRLSLFPGFILILWFAAFNYPAWLKRDIAFCASLLALALIGSRLANYIELNSYLSEYVSCTKMIAPESTVLPLSLWNCRRPDGKILTLGPQPFVHAAGYIAAEKNIVSLNNHEADTNFFPIVYREAVNPYRFIGQAKGGSGPYERSTMEDESPAVDFLNYRAHTGGQVDYVLIWGEDYLLDRTAAGRHIRCQLEAGYKLIYTSPQRALVHLYERNDHLPAGTADPVSL